MQAKTVIQIIQSEKITFIVSFPPELREKGIWTSGLLGGDVFSGLGGGIRGGPNYVVYYLFLNSYLYFPFYLSILTSFTQFSNNEEFPEHSRETQILNPKT